MKKLVFSFLMIFFVFTFVSAQLLDNIKLELGTGGKKKGYYNTTQIGLLMGNKEKPGYTYTYFYDYRPSVSGYYPEIGLKLIPSVTMVNGYMFNAHWSAGIGLGIEIFEYNTYPVFTEVKYTFWDKKISPYFTFKGGYSIADLKEKHYDNGKTIDFYPYSLGNCDIQNFGGLMINPEIGVKVGLSNNADLLISAGYRYQELKSKAIQKYNSGDVVYYSGDVVYYDRWDNKQHLNRLVFGIAVLFK